MDLYVLRLAEDGAAVRNGKMRVQIWDADVVFTSDTIQAHAYTHPLQHTHAHYNTHSPSSPSIRSSSFRAEPGRSTRTVKRWVGEGGQNFASHSQPSPSSSSSSSSRARVSVTLKCFGFALNGFVFISHTFLILPVCAAKPRLAEPPILPVTAILQFNNLTRPEAHHRPVPSRRNVHIQWNVHRSSSPASSLCMRDLCSDSAGS